MTRRSFPPSTFVLALGVVTTSGLTPLSASLHAQSGSNSGAVAPSSEPKLTSTALPGRQSWISDRRDFHLGDIVTILVDEYTLTSLDKQFDATDSRQRNLAFSAGSGNPTTTSISTTNNATSANRGLDARTNRLTTEMSARVIEIAPNGIMKLQGNKAINVEKTKITMTLTGWVRAQDVSPSNAVQSFHMADAQLDYQAEGPLGSPKGGIIGRLLGKFWP